MAHPDAAVRFYDRFAPRYDRSFQFYLRPSYNLALEALDPNPGERLLDIGAGTGELELRLCRRVPDLHLVAIEPARGMADLARTKLQSAGCPAQVLDGPFESQDPTTLGTFDWIVACNVLHFLGDPPAAIARWSQALKPGGHLVIVTLDGGLLPIRLAQPVLRSAIGGFTGAHRLAEVEDYVRGAGLAVNLAERRRFSPAVGALLVRGKRDMPVGA
ncbi:MAG TPA: methyltransferase [bacterium]|nr:methyltransferase [bacterium]